MARHNDLIGHNTSPDRNKPNPSPNRPHAAEPTRKALVTRESWNVLFATLLKRIVRNGLLET